MVGERREEEWESWKTRCAPLRPSTDGDRGTANSVGSYSRRPAGALQHATSACRSRPNARLRLTSAPNKTTNFARRPLRLAPFRHPPLLLPRFVQRARGYACYSLHRWPLRGVTLPTEFVIRKNNESKNLVNS